MSVDITIPSPGESIAEVTVGSWMKQSGDWVEKDEIILEIESDKATLEIVAWRDESSLRPRHRLLPGAPDHRRHGAALPPVVAPGRLLAAPRLRLGALEHAGVEGGQVLGQCRAVEALA